MKPNKQQVFDSIAENAEIIAFCDIDLHMSDDMMLTCRFKKCGATMTCNIISRSVEIRHDGVVSHVTPYRSGLATMTFKRELHKTDVPNAVIACNGILCS